jgi:hypothetical protein
MPAWSVVLFPGFQALLDRTAITRPAAESAHHHPSQAFRPTPSRAVAEVSAQNAVSVESAINVRLPSVRPVRRFARAGDPAG